MLWTSIDPSWVGNGNGKVGEEVQRWKSRLVFIRIYAAAGSSRHRLAQAGTGVSTCSGTAFFALEGVIANFWPVTVANTDSSLNKAPMIAQQSPQQGHILYQTCGAVSRKEAVGPDTMYS